MTQRINDIYCATQPELKCVIIRSSDVITENCVYYQIYNNETDRLDLATRWATYSAVIDSVLDNSGE